MKGKGCRFLSIEGDSIGTVLFCDMEKAVSEISIKPGGRYYYRPHSGGVSLAGLAGAALDSGLGINPSDPELENKTRHEKIITATNAVRDEVRDTVFNEALEANNPLALQVVSGAKGSKQNVASLLGIALPSSRPYQTCAGFLLQEFGTIPEVGEKIAANGWQFEIVDLDGRRIDKVLASKPVP